MHFSTIASILAAAATIVSAGNIITLKSIDDVDRTVYFTANAGLAKLSPVPVKAGASVDVPIPHGWIGNFYSVSKGKVNKPGMLGEVAFNGWNGFTYFDVSAIVDPNDFEGVSEMYPATGLKPTSGCKTFPCNNAYYLPDDVQTKVTSETHIITTLGKNGYAAKRYASPEEEEEFVAEHLNVKRHHVEGKWFSSWF